MYFPPISGPLKEKTARARSWLSMATTTTKSKRKVAQSGAAPAPLDLPLMHNNIPRADLDTLIEYLRQESPMLTQSAQVRLFEQEWSAWLGVKHSVFVNSGASANLLTMTALRETFGPGGVIVPTLTWVSDRSEERR